VLSTITYILLYYAFVTNLSRKHVYRVLSISLITGLLVSLWGFPSHFGVDPTCYVVRGSFDISCWTEQFVPTVRVFSTLGQPAWFAAYISILLPIVLAFFLHAANEATGEKKAFSLSSFKSLPRIAFGYIFLTALLYICLTFSNTRAGVLGFLFGNLFFWIALFILFRKRLRHILTLFVLCTLLFVLCNFFFGVIFQPFQRFSIGYKLQDAIMHKTQIAPSPQPAVVTISITPTPVQASVKDKQVEIGVANITDSGNIRQNVWRGAIAAWKANPIFGTGVETFAFAYYKHKPVEQNNTSEWDFLYNKAHNEYLNYLATTGLYGFGTYLLFLAWFGFLLTRWFRKHTTATEKDPLLVVGLAAGYLTMLFSNFFGFSVVIVNLYLFLIPAFTFILLDMLKKPTPTPAPQNNKPYMQNSKHALTPSPSLLGWSMIALTWIFCFYILYSLFVFWNADKAYSLGSNLDRVGQYQQAYPKLLEAVNARKSEPVFQDEFAFNSAVLATGFAAQKDEKNAQTMTQQAITLSDQIVLEHPSNIVFLKNRVRMLYELSKINPQYIGLALQTILRAYELAPNDAKIAYNAGVLLGQTGQVTQGIDVLERAARLKPDFRDVRFALGLFYRDQATKGGKTVVNKDFEQKAEENLRFILEKINPTDKQTQDMLASWGVTSSH
jgi:O-antigen ligase/Flp pilus assembly protein TadD